MLLKQDTEPPKPSAAPIWCKAELQKSDIAPPKQDDDLPNVDVDSFSIDATPIWCKVELPKQDVRLSKVDSDSFSIAIDAPSQDAALFGATSTLLASLAVSG